MPPRLGPAGWLQRLGTRLLLILAAAPLAACCPCANNGTCNEVLRTCACPPSFSGAACEEQVFPACRLTAAPPAPPHWLPATGARCSHSEQPRSCACLRQCAAAGERLARPLPEPASGRYDVDWLRCFERTRVAEADQLSDLPAEGEAAAWLEHHRAGAAAVPRAKVTASHHGTLMPLAACPGNCSFEGACHATAGEHKMVCRCYAGFGGDACERVEPDACLNRCNGRGACVRGFCSCAPGWSGRDCSVAAGALRAALSRPNVTRSAAALRIYIHQLPAWADVAARVDKPARADLHGGNYAAYWEFLSRLSNDFAVRTLDPREASLFLVPVDVYALTNNVGAGGVDFVRRALDDLARTAEPAAAAALALRNGSDHVVWSPQDRGYCDEIGAQPAWMRKLVWVTHYLPRAAGKGGTPQAEPCFGGVPPIVAPGVTMLLKRNTPEQCAAHFGDVARRDIFFVFVGGLHLLKREHSGGVRQDVYAHYHRAPGYVVQARSANYTDLMSRARFCLDPEGEGWSQRMLEAACAGCIPVTIQPSGARAPGDDVLPYWRFSVRLALEDIPSMDAMLRAISDEEWLQMQRVLLQHSSSFWWRGNDTAGAYHLVLESMRRHVWQTAARYW